MRDRFIAVSVAMRGHPVVGHDVPPPPPADKSRHALAPMLAFQDLIAEAAWRCRDVRDKDRVITLERGQFRAGRAYWAKRWNWSEKSVRSFFAKLVREGIIEISGQSEGHYANVATLCNYDKYQSPPDSDDQWPGQNLTKDTKDTKSTVLPCPADGERLNAAALSDDQVISFIARIESLAGEALADKIKAPQLMHPGPVHSWLESGAHPELDIVPAIQVLSQKALNAGRRRSIKTWAYFTDAVAENVSNRKAGLPVKQARGAMSASSEIAKINAMAGSSLQ